MKFNYLRIIALFVALATVGMFASCSSNNGGGGEGETTAAFVGSWTLVKVTFTGETAQPSDFQGFTITLGATKNYSLANPLAFPSPTNAAGTYQSANGSLSFDTGTSVRLVSTSGNTMVWEWEVSRPGKITATYRYTFERN
jgi:hypothetical protein